MKTFSTSWKSSSKARKQRKYRANLPIHLRKQLVCSHLSKELRQKLKKRSIVVKVGDKVKVAVGEFKKKEGKIEKVDRKNEKIYITGIDETKKDGTKRLVGIHPSNLIVTEIKEDKNRIASKEKSNAPEAQKHKKSEAQRTASSSAQNAKAFEEKK